MDPGEAVRRCGGRATWRQLRELGVTWRQIRAAVEEGSVTRSARGRYRWGTDEHDLGVAHQVHGTLSHRSAALHHGLEVWTAPERPEVLVRRNRRLVRAHRSLAVLRYRDLSPDETSDGVTTVRRTVLDCIRDLDLVEALAVADSALRRGAVTREELETATRAMRGARAARARHVASLADGRAANPFESALRAFAIEAGLQVTPQYPIGEPGTEAYADLADVGRQLLIEAEGYEEHGTRRGFRKDIRRYTVAAVQGWTVLRFTWEDAMLQASYVRWALGTWRRCKDGDQHVVGPPPPVLRRLA